MSVQDKIKWDKKYIDTPKLLQKREPSSKLVKFVVDGKDKTALDVACGNGRNSIYLAKLGFKVDAIDISRIALDNLNANKIKNITTHLIDLEGFSTKTDYDVIIMTNYLDRLLIPKLLLSLKAGGTLIIETYMNHPSNTKPNSNPDFLLQKDELKKFVNNEYKIVEYQEFDNEPYELYRMKKQSIVIKKT